MSRSVNRRALLTGLGTSAVGGLGAVAAAGPASAAGASTGTATGSAAPTAPAGHHGRPGHGDAPLIGRARGSRLHVMTFNIRMENTAQTKPGEADHWPEREPILVDLLEREQPTILGIQEGKYGQLAAIEQALPHHRMIGYGRQGGSADEYSAIFYDPRRLRVLEWDQFWLSDTPDVIGSATWGNRVTRIVVWARMQDRRTGRELAMINTHFDHESENARIKSAQAMVDLFSDGALEGLPTIVTGDFNSPAEDSGAYTTLVGDGPMLDTWSSARKHLTRDWGTFPGYEDPVEGGDRIDWVLTTDDVTAHAVGINVHRSPAGRYPSDHAPVQALISLH
ncbi:endonuclease/exonuclease/phosphatase family protein [Brachybacterium kimchii]|uniref:Endonuclease/exonuclease/phosphatase family protein n=1 Tax=Brachybacterium kimchii TaxID=2942909 RepID=A0ABY4N435_9MICO|nr:endonuclease/exonuclease/phosphatase family protein [Brachybacterium kimchii]UQN28914.1 endonuclease/exonuclease/phosphatase family protein [Brachybacterium kimchii]